MPRPTPTKEQQLLFNILKGETPASLEGVDTELLFDLFRRHRLFPLAQHLLPLLDEKERERWKEAIRSKSLRSMHQLAILGQITGKLREAGIEAIPLKGPVLAQTLYGNLAERHSSDIDLLVSYEELQQVTEILGREGFELIYPRAGLSERHWKYYSRYKKDIGLINRVNGILVELHYSIENYIGLGPEELVRFFQQTTTTDIGGTHFRTMNNHQAFLYLAFHGAVHQYRRLFWLRDIAMAISRWELDHGQILEDAQRMRTERLVGVSVELAGELFGVVVPEAYSPYLTENRSVIEKLKRTCIKIVLGPEFPSFRGKIRHHLFMLRLKPAMTHYLRTMGEIINRQYIGRFLGGH